MVRALTHALSHSIHEGMPTTGRIRPSKWDATSGFFIPLIVPPPYFCFLILAQLYKQCYCIWIVISVMKFCYSPQVCSQIAAQRAANPNLDKLYIKKDSSCSGLVDQLFMDTAVYSRNRCFRLAFSSKSGKKSFLVPTGRFKCKEMVRSWSHFF
jgi:hypothetical protein